jgi:hypothetical protein
MKIKALFIAGLNAVMCLALFAQQPPAGGGQGAPGAARGGRGERGGRAPAPPPTGPVANATNAIITAINNQDATSLRTALSSDAIVVDEDGHVGNPATVWALRLSGSKRMANLMVGELGDGGAWAAFNYTLEETASGQAPPIQGSGTIVYSKSGTDLKAVVIQLSINGRAIVTHTGEP